MKYLLDVGFTYFISFAAFKNESVEKIHEKAFLNCQLKSVTVLNPSLQVGEIFGDEDFTEVLFLKYSNNNYCIFGL